MRARYATACAACGGRIQPGEEISSAGKDRTGWMHAACAPGLFDAPPDTESTPPVRAASAAKTAATKTASSKTAPSKTGASKFATAKTKRVRTDAPPPDGATFVYTDGACQGNPGPGGWAWAARDGRQASGGDPATTNQRMEIKAALEAVRALDDSPLVVVSDSTYVVNCFRDRWWVGWLARD